MNDRARRALPYVVLFGALALVPLGGSYAMGIVAEVLIFGLFAMSLNLLVGFTGLLSFGHAAFFGVGAYTVAILGTHAAINGWLGLVAGVLAAALSAAAIGFFCIRVSGIPFLMLTLAFSQLLYSIAVKSRQVTGGTDGVSGFQRPALFGASLDSRPVLYAVIVVGFAIGLIVLQRLIASPLGSVFVGIRDNEVRMRALGYPVQRFKLIAFVIAGAIAGFAGGLYAFFNVFVSTDILHWSQSGDAIIMVIVGGSGTIFGPVVGAAIFLLLKNVLSSHFDYWSLGVGAVFIASVMFLRSGVWGALVARNRRAGAGP